MELEGLVVDVGGQPIPNADVLACAGEYYPCAYAAERLELDDLTPAEELREVYKHNILSDASAHTKTDADGRWHVALTPKRAGGQYVVVAADGYVPKGTANFARVEVEPAGTIAVTFDCSGKSCDPTTTGILKERGFMREWVTSPFKLRRQPAGPRRIEMRSRTFRPGEHEGDGTAIVRPGAEVPVHIRLKRTGHDEKLLVDVVLDKDVASATLFSTCSGRRRQFDKVPTGPFTLDDVGPGPCAIAVGSSPRPGSGASGCPSQGSISAVPGGPRVRIHVKACPMRRGRFHGEFGN